MRKTITTMLSALLVLSLLSGCGDRTAGSAVSASASSTGQVVSEIPEETAAPRTAFRIAGLNGPTTMGMVKLMSDAEAGGTRHDYAVEIFGAADEVNTKLIGGELDAAMVPANVASVLYNKTQGQIKVAAVNTLGVLYVVETGDSISSVADLAGKTVYATGKGQTPEFVLNYLLRQNGLDPAADLTIEYKSEATEVAALLAETDDAIAVLPQPYVTVAQAKNEKLRVALNLTEEWDKVSESSALVTGVLVVRTEFIEANSEAFAEFLQDYQASIEWVRANTKEAAELVVQYGIVPQVPLAEKALPQCNITFVAGGEMKNMLRGYLQVLFDQMPESVGGALPDDEFYHL